MKKLIFILLVALAVPSVSQSFKTKPYLEDVEPDHVHISWITDSNTETIVEWGTDTDLGNSTNGTSFTTLFDDVVHQVVLTGLSPETAYYYKAVTGSLVTETYRFVTPALSSAEQSFNLVAMSDMQRDNSQPQKFDEIVNEGIVPVIEEQYGSEASDHLGMILIPGDLVVNGLDYESWFDEFFQQLGDLTSEVPVYPVLGNHEVNSQYYFDFFHLPENGSDGYNEHWWYKDYSNVRIIGLNSNPPYDNFTQLTWLEDLLDQTCSEEHIDFVFAQLHHPHESELWTPGESSFSTDVVDALVEFTENCNKPSVHFFGHTHGYSRGQNKDHEHVMVNVATAGGAIDHWGEWPQNDYEDFTVSQAEYGFVIMEVDAGAEAQFKLKRYSQGHQYNIRNNEITDSLTVKKHNLSPGTPAGISPNGTTVSPDCILLIGSPFVDPDGDEHMASEWQVATDAGFTDVIYESFRNHQNWYFFEDRSAGDILVDEKIEGLPENTSLFWRVRYRDYSLGWSPWSSPIGFNTSSSIMSDNLVMNPGAESGTSNWTTVAGALESLTAGQCAGTSPHTGTYYFGVGALCDNNAYGEAHQLIDVDSYSVLIDEGNQFVRWGGWLSDYNGSDIPEIQLEFLNESSGVIGSSEEMNTSSSAWTYYENTTSIPEGTRDIRFILRGYRNAGVDNDSYIDDLFLHILDGGCDDSLFDADEDGIVDSADNCPDLPNPDQLDFNDNNVGDLCEDSDDDGLTDHEEIQIYGTNPLEVDSDMDGISDFDETQVIGANPLLQDSDFDGLTDSLELNTSLTDPLNEDTDGNGCNDALEFGQLCYEGNIICEIDTNGDFVINILDLIAISTYFGQVCE